MPAAEHHRTTHIDTTVAWVTMDLLDDATVGMALVATDGLVLWVNQAMCDLLDRDREELRSTAWADLLPPGDQHAAWDDFEALTAGRLDRIHSHRRFLRPGGDTLTARTTTSTISVLEGEPVFFLQVHEAGEPPAAGHTLRSGQDRRADASLGDTSGDALEAVLDATRTLFWVREPADAATAAQRLITALGAALVPAGESDPSSVPMDVAFGVGEPVLPMAPIPSVARALVERYLPSFMLDAQRALELASRTARLEADASLDGLTGLANRRRLDRLLARLLPEDTVIMIDLDHFKAVNDDLGHPAGDAVLKALGRALSTTVRARDHAGRYGGEEFVVILGAQGEPGPFLERLRSVWESVRPHPVTLSAGVAPAHLNPAAALRAADRALYRAKSSGRNQWQWATEEDYA